GAAGRNGRGGRRGDGKIGCIRAGDEHGGGACQGQGKAAGIGNRVGARDLADGGVGRGVHVAIIGEVSGRRGNIAGGNGGAVARDGNTGDGSTHRNGGYGVDEGGIGGNTALGDGAVTQIGGDDDGASFARLNSKQAFA